MMAQKVYDTYILCAAAADDDDLSLLHFGLTCRKNVSFFVLFLSIYYVLFYFINRILFQGFSNRNSNEYKLTC